ncbi:MAG: HEAT repeat domain-containing protein [Planctomycetes bacterium]|nr:HEAT repeat domain-containing protein [Planctomycetota bacterium]
MSSRRLHTITLGIFLLGGITLVAAPTRDEVEAEKCIKMLKTSKDAKDKIFALKELGRLGAISTSLAKPAVEDIIKALDDKDPKVKAAAAHAIGKIDPTNKKQVVDKLIQILKEEKDESVKQGAALGLGAMGPDAKDAVPAIREAMAKAPKNDARQYQAALMAITGRKN